MKNWIFCGFAVLEQTFAKWYLHISKTFSKIRLKFFQPKKSYKKTIFLRAGGTLHYAILNIFVLRSYSNPPRAFIQTPFRLFMRAKRTYTGIPSRNPISSILNPAGKRQITHLGLGVKQARCVCFWLPLGQTDRNTCMVIMTIFKKSYNGFIRNIWNFTGFGPFWRRIRW